MNDLRSVTKITQQEKKLEVEQTCSLTQRERSTAAVGGERFSPRYSGILSSLALLGQPDCCVVLCCVVEESTSRTTSSSSSSAVTAVYNHNNNGSDASNSLCSTSSSSTDRVLGSPAWSDASPPVRTGVVLSSKDGLFCVNGNVPLTLAPLYFVVPFGRDPLAVFCH